MSQKNRLDALVQDLQKFVATKKTLESEGLNTEQKRSLFIDLTEASANVAESIERELRAEFGRLLKEWESQQPWAKRDRGEPVDFVEVYQERTPIRSMRAWT
jgi:hypothetical protein